MFLHLVSLSVLAMLQDPPATPAPPTAPVAPAAPAAPATPVALHFAKARYLGGGIAPLPRRPLVADVDGDGFGDLLAIDLSAGLMDVAFSVRGGKFIAPARAVSDLGADLADVATRVAANGRAEIVVARADGSRRVIAYGDDKVWHVRDDEPTASAPAGTPPNSAATPASSAAGTAAPLLRSDFDGDGVLDEITGATLKRAADPDHPLVLPELESLPKDAAVVAGDLNGDHRADLVVFRRDDAWRTGQDVVAYLAYADGDADADGDGLDAATEAKLGSDPLDADTDHDGLLDGFEVKGEGALDFPVLGASPTHKDCFVYVQRYSETDGAGCMREVERVVKTWSELPNKNVDGKTGLALHPVWLPPLPPGTPGKAWWDLGNENLPKGARGLAHYMELNAGGGGQAAELGDMGGCGTAALWACFLHEFGHQVGLSHSGGPLPDMCPTYTSLMSYAYSYGFEDDGNKIHYSNGELANLVLNENRLSERIELPFEKLAFLAKGPFRFKMQADATAAGVTWIDWNRNGAFEPGTVRADVTDVYGAGGSSLFGGMGKTVFAPALLDHDGQLLLFTVTRERSLMRRRVLGPSQFEEAAPVTAIATGAPTGDLAGVVDGQTIRLFVPTAEGIVLLSANDAAGLDKAAPVLLPDTKGFAVSATLLAGRPLIVTWKDADSPLRTIAVDDAGNFAAFADLGALRSETPPGAAEDPTTHELVVGTCAAIKDEKGEHHAWKATRFTRNDAGAFIEGANRTVGGEGSGWCGNSRPVLLFETGPGALSPGRLHFIGRGFTNPVDANGCFFEAITIGDPSQNDGWRLRRWINEWTTTKSPVAACLHDGDLAIAYRWFGNVHGDEDDDAHVILGCYGIGEKDMHDFDDVGEIAEIGLEHSIPWRDAGVK